MKDIAPKILRQRLLIEATYDITVSEETIKTFLLELAKHLDMRTYGDPLIYSPKGKGKKMNQGFDAFIPLIDSGFSLYVWTAQNFLSLVMYTCKKFENDKAIAFTENFFKAPQIEHKIF